MQISQEEHEQLLGAIDALKYAMIEVANALSREARHGIASEIDVYGSRVVLKPDSDKSAKSFSRREAQQNTAWEIAERIWPHLNSTCTER